jgi:hypothetical protein
LTAGRAGRSTKLVFGNAIEAHYQKLKVACGQCIGCRLDHSLRWATRCMHESRSYESNSFITLTYSDEHLPRDMSLSLSEFQRFAKRLRKRLEPERIKIFHCGEYSPKRSKFIVPGTTVDPSNATEGQRPHYHAIIFGHDFPDKELWSVRNDICVYSSDTLADIWGKGFCTVGDLTFESAAYVARYTVKKLNGARAEKIDETTGLRPYERTCPITGEIREVAKEYATMSNGIGMDHYHRYTSDIYPADHVVINGHETRPPRYYDDLYAAQEPASMEEIKDRRIKQMELHAADNTPSRLREREKVKMAQLQMLKREEVK